MPEKPDCGSQHSDYTSKLTSKEYGNRRSILNKQNFSGPAAARRITVFVISAPSGSGKSTLVARLMAHDSSLRFSVSYTTRKPRGNEKPGENYVYITPEEFRKRIDRGEFLEYAEVFGNYYGTHREVLDQAQAEGKDLILDIDVKGARQLKERVPEAVTIFILPPS